MTAADGRPDAEAERCFEVVARTIGAARAVRSEHEVHPGARVPLRLRADDEALRALLSAEERLIGFLVRAEGAPAIETPGERPSGHVLTMAGDVEVLVGLLGLVEPAHEADRIERGLKRLDKEIRARSTEARAGTTRRRAVCAAGSGRTVLNAECSRRIAATRRRLETAAFVEKAPPELVTAAREKLEASSRQRAQLEQARALVDELESR